MTKTGNRIWRGVLLIAALWWMAGSDALAQQSISGEVGVELRGFSNEALHDGQARHAASVFFSPEIFLDWAGGDQRFVMTPFARLDADDKTRSHVDLREAYWQWFGRSLQVRAGFIHVFWGVTESQHLVDIINQTDAIEAPDGEAKLGQPAVELNWISDFGTIDVFAMPFFRERSFPGMSGRLRPPFVIDFDRGFRSERLDLGFRYSHYFGSFDFGLTGFWGTSREPQFSLDPQSGIVNTSYPVIQQLGLDTQWTIGSTLAKLEAIYRSGYGSDFGAISAGIEYTFGNVSNTGLDVGLLAELHLDGRDDILLGDQRFHTTPFDNDVFGGIRLSFSDVQSTAILGGAVFDRKTKETALFIESSRRIGERMTATFEVRTFSKTSPDSPLSFYREDDYAQLSVSYFF